MACVCVCLRVCAVYVVQQQNDTNGKLKHNQKHSDYIYLLQACYSKIATVSWSWIDNETSIAIVCERKAFQNQFLRWKKNSITSEVCTFLRSHSTANTMPLTIFHLFQKFLFFCVLSLRQANLLGLVIACFLFVFVRAYARGIDFGNQSIEFESWSVLIEPPCAILNLG